MSTLDDALIAAHAQGDKTALTALYTQAAQATSDEDARAFFLTHAYIFALETNAPETPTLHAALIKMGRDTP